MGFVYKNIPAFNLGLGDSIAFDTGGTNDTPLQFNIELASAAANGASVEDSNGYTVVSSGLAAAVF